MNNFSTFFPTYRVFSQLESQIFGSVAFVHVPSQGRSKLDPHSLKCVFLGYFATEKGYWCYCPQKRKYYTSTDVTFFENQAFYPRNLPQGESGSDPNFWEQFKISNSEIIVPNTNLNEEISNWKTIQKSNSITPNLAPNPSELNWDPAPQNPKVESVMKNKEIIPYPKPTP